MRASEALIFCDGDDGDCGAWELDYYAQNASAVNGTPITLTERAPGWTTTADDADYCPDHKPQPTPATA